MPQEPASTPTALIIGGCKGIGRAIAARLARDGFDILASSRQDSQDVVATAELVHQAGRQFTLLTFDVGNREQCRAALAPLLADAALPEVVVYNAGMARDNLFAFMDPSEWQDVIRTNLDGFYNTVQPFVLGMIARRRGRIIAISSASGQAGQAGQVNYSAAKAALIGAVKALAREIGRKGILVNVVAPGVISTAMTAELPLERILPLIPLNRVGAVDEVAGAVSFLAGPDSSYVHGQVLAVNGGLVI